MWTERFSPSASVTDLYRRTGTSVQGSECIKKGNPWMDSWTKFTSTLRLFTATKSDTMFSTSKRKAESLGPSVFRPGGGLRRRRRQRRKLRLIDTLDGRVTRTNRRIGRLAIRRDITRHIMCRHIRRVRRRRSGVTDRRRMLLTSRHVITRRLRGLFLGIRWDQR